MACGTNSVRLKVAIHLAYHPPSLLGIEVDQSLLWFSLDGLCAEPFGMELGLRQGSHFVAPPSRKTSDAMIRSLGERTIVGRRAGSRLAITDRLAEAIGSSLLPSVINQVRSIIAEEFADPGLSAAGIARRLGCHRITLSRLFHRETDQTLVSYLGLQGHRQRVRGHLRHPSQRVRIVSHKNYIYR